ncbi:hypothetical protein VHEMI08979 [[Torrubiella] hemipterigena]|uniref:Uncharacterized protein n=1 Tax=[Torrubiella] hemipterigena TaxID=1531966 RepID=A0A0A1TQN2_9HYPO|nr:hypothetical protein VHEMI08979 [[Torrubiella] hemipterigena]
MSFYGIWKVCSGPVGLVVGIRTIPAFEDALLACRATDTIRHAIETGVEVPDIGPICDMTAKARPPTVAELRQCKDLHYLVHHFQAIFFALDGGKYTRFIEEQHGESEFTWADRFHRVIFRVFLAGSVLCKAHNHPIWLRICQENVRLRWAAPQTREFVRQALHDFPTRLAL